MSFTTAKTNKRINLPAQITLGALKAMEPQIIDFQNVPHSLTLFKTKTPVVILDCGTTRKNQRQWSETL